MTMLRKAPKFFLYLFLVACGVTFSVSNRAVVKVTLFPLPFEISLPLFLLTIAAIAAGMFIGWTIARIRMFKVVKAAKHAGERAIALQHEVEALRHEKLIKQK